jgi:hypothetical protein
MKDSPENRGRTTREDGYALFAVMVVVSIVTIWMVDAALATGYGVLAAASTRDRLNARIAANERVSGAIPTGTGGSVWPDAPVAGFYDLLVTDASSGTLREVSPEERLPDGLFVLRQWRIAANAGGGRLLEVSTVIVDARTHEVVAGPSGGEFRRSQIVE